MKWFEVDKTGLKKLIERKGKAFIVHELVQNAWDENTTCVRVTITEVPGSPRARLVIEDDSPDGFADLAHAYTLFAESYKKQHATKRGRFNLGEKLVLAMCEEATIISTTGGVRFDSSGRHSLRTKREAGTRFEALFRITRKEIAEIVESAQQLRPPRGICTTINGVELVEEDPVAVIEVTLPTEVADEDGNLRKTKRKTQIRIFNPKQEIGWIYEMGIPVVETGDRFDVDISQKVPLSFDRDNVTPSYLQTVRTHVLNATARLLTEEESSADWVSMAAASNEVSGDAINTVLTNRFGDDPTSYDPSDMEANARAVAAGKSLVPGGSMSRGMWEQARRYGAITPAGKAFGTTGAYSNTGEPEVVTNHSDWTPGMQRVAEFAKWAARTALKIEIRVKMTVAGNNFLACYGDRELTFNLRTLGRAWFDGEPAEIVDLIVHELGHQIECSHLSDRYYHALTRIAGELFVKASDAPNLIAAESEFD